MPVSAGFWNIGVAAYKETNHNGIVGKSVSFKVAPALTSVWAIPAGAGTFGGFVSVVGPKGKDGFGSETKTETLARATYMFNVMGPKSALTAGIGVQFNESADGESARTKIESILAGIVSADRPTHTM